MKSSILIFCVFFVIIDLNSQHINSNERLPEIIKKGIGKENLLLIPCMGCRWNVWEEFMERNSSRYTMYAITAPGFGGTPAPNLTKNSQKTPYRNYLLTGLSDLINDFKLKKLTVIGHSWGAMIATQLASQRRDAITRLISIDGKITGAILIKDSEKRFIQANKFASDWRIKLKNAEEWSKFNGANIGLIIDKKDSVIKEEMLTEIKLRTGLMATNREAMIQYWRENFLINLKRHLNNLEIPILDIQSFSGKHQDIQKKNYLERLKDLKVSKNISSIFMFDTKHFIMYHKPKELDHIVANFFK